MLNFRVLTLLLPPSLPPSLNSRFATVLIHVFYAEGIKRAILPRVELALQFGDSEALAEGDALLDALAEGVLFLWGREGGKKGGEVVEVKTGMIKCFSAFPFLSKSQPAHRPLVMHIALNHILSLPPSLPYSLHTLM